MSDNIKPSFRTDKYIDDVDLSGFTFITNRPLSYIEGDDNLAYLLKRKQDNIDDTSEPNSVLTTDNEGAINWIDIDTFLSGATGAGDVVTGQTLADGTVNGSHVIWNDSASEWEESAEMVFDTANDSFTTHSSNTVTGQKAIAFGGEDTNLGISGNTASGDLSLVWGANNVASGIFSTVWGFGNVASVEFSTVWGIENVASGEFSTVWGYENIASGYDSTVWGRDNRVIGDYSTVWGSNNIASGQASTAWGDRNEAFSYVETSFGSYSTTYTPNNIADFDENDRVLTIGNGTDDTNRSDATRVWKSGYHEFIGTINISATTSGEGSTPKEGDIRYTDSGGFEGYGDTGWRSFNAMGGKVNTSVTANTNTTLSTDVYVYVIDTTDNVVNLTLPNNPELGREYKIVDNGNAGTNNITITPQGGGNINGNSNYTITSNYEVATLIFNGIGWNGF